MREQWRSNPSKGEKKGGVSRDRVLPLGNSFSPGGEMEMEMEMESKIKLVLHNKNTSSQKRKKK